MSVEIVLFQPYLHSSIMGGLQPAAGMTDLNQQRDTVVYVDFPDQWMEIAMFAAMAESEAIEPSYEEAKRTCRLAQKA